MADFSDIASFGLGLASIGASTFAAVNNSNNAKSKGQILPNAVVTQPSGLSSQTLIIIAVVGFVGIFAIMEFARK
jgi:hypothetical protein